MTDGLRLLLFNLATDPQDPVLGFASRWVESFAGQASAVHVITMRKGPHDLPENVSVRSLGKELGRSEPRRLLSFYSHLLAILRQGVDAAFSHMTPLFSALAAPVVRPLGIPLVTWYAHPSLTFQVKLADRLSSRMVTSVPGAYPYRDHKLTVVGQGIDTALFSPRPVAPDDPPTILCAGRLSPVKDHPTFLQGVRLLEEAMPGSFRACIVGAPASPADEPYVASLRRLTDELGLQRIVSFHPAVPPVELPALYSRARLHVNLTPRGFGDKVAWEAMACGTPCLVANPDFGETLGPHASALSFDYGDPRSLAARLGALWRRSDDELERIGLDLRQRVAELHGLDRLTGVVTSMLRELRR